MIGRSSNPANLEALIAGLEATPARILNSCEAIEADALHTSRQDGWSIRQILAHLRGCQYVYGQTVLAALMLDEPVLSYLHPLDWMRLHAETPLDFWEALRYFQIGRQEFVRILSGLSLDDWERGAIIRERRHTVYKEVRRIFTHEEGHCEEIERLAGAFR